jgi:hypothetical protein
MKYCYRILWMLPVLLLAGCGGGGSGGGGTHGTPPVANADGDSVPDSSDCAPTDAARWQMLPYASVDADGDTHQVSSTGQICAGASLPTGYYAVAAVEESDCDDTDATHWKMLPFVSTDLDGDGRRVAASAMVCSGDTLPSGYFDSAASTSDADCDDSDNAKWRYASIYADHDSDGIGSGLPIVACIGSGAPSGKSMAGYDPLDDTAVPNARSVREADISPALLTTP